MRRLDSLFLERKIIELVEARLPSLARILKKLLAETEANLCARYINRWRKRVFFYYIGLLGEILDTKLHTY